MTFELFLCEFKGHAYVLCARRESLGTRLSVPSLMRCLGGLVDRTPPMSAGDGVVESHSLKIATQEHYIQQIKAKQGQVFVPSLLRCLGSLVGRTSAMSAGDSGSVQLYSLKTVTTTCLVLPSSVTWQRLHKSFHV